MFPVPPAPLSLGPLPFPSWEMRTRLDFNHDRLSTLGAPILKLEEKTSHSCFRLGLSLATHGGRGHSREGLELKVLFKGENRSVLMEGDTQSGGVLGIIQASGS